jgi:hypothetical protein
LAIVVAFLVAVNVVDARVAHAALVLGPAGAAGLLALGRAELGRAGPGPGHLVARAALAAIGAVAVVFAAGAALPLTRSAFRDTRYDFGWGTRC